MWGFGWIGFTPSLSLQKVITSSNRAEEGGEFFVRLGVSLLDSEGELQVDPVLYDFAVFDQRLLSYYVDASNVSEGLRRSSDCFIDSVFESSL